MTLATLNDLHAQLLDAAATALGLADASVLRITDPPDERLGDLAIACHRAGRQAGLDPEDAAKKLAEQLATLEFVMAAEGARGFCNVRLAASGLWQVLTGARTQPESFGRNPRITPQTWIIEFSSPNTNKPLHIGHLRNTILGDALSNVVSLFGHQVLKYNIINDRGIHICKSMVAYHRFGDQSTPEDTGEKGDKFVGRFYTLFDRKAEQEFANWTEGPGQDALKQYRMEQAGRIQDSADLKLRREFLDEHLQHGGELSFKPKKKKPKQYPELMQKDGLERPYQEWRRQHQERVQEREQSEGQRLFLAESARLFEAEISKLHAETREFLKLWEAKDPFVRGLWKQMNTWVLAGIHQTYERLGIQFDHIDYESETYLLGRELVEQLLKDGTAHRREDGAVFAEIPSPNPQEPPLEKVLLRADGTSIYITQDLGTFMRRFEAHDPEVMIYVVGSEQELHFQNLFALVESLGPGMGSRCIHLSYGMVELPHGKMKSRQGEIIEADEFLDDVCQAANRIQSEAARRSQESENAPAGELEQRSEVIAMATVKYHLLKYSKQSTVKFEVEDALDLTGKTGPYCLYAVARIRSILRRLKASGFSTEVREDVELPDVAPEEVQLLYLVARFPEVVAQSVRDLEPFHIADYVYRLARSFSAYFSAKNDDGSSRFPVAKETDPRRREFRIALVWLIEAALDNGLSSLGIETLDEM